jgi:hypothetical protein
MKYLIISTFLFFSLQNLVAQQVINGISVPSGFPTIEIDTTQKTASGNILLSTWAKGPPYNIILKNDGTPYFYQRIPDSLLTLNFI